MIGFVGCRTTRARNARGEGISTLECNPQTGELTRIALSEGWTNPSYLALNKARTRLYTVHGDGREVSVFVVNGDLPLQHLQTCSTEGRNPVHLALSADERCLVISNHIEGGVVVLDIDDDGRLSPVQQMFLLPGEPGPHRVEQPFSKPHFNPFDPSGRWLLVPDKGLDRVFSFGYDNGRLTPCESFFSTSREGAGPRNLVYHPHKPWVYVVNELDSTVTAYHLNQDTGAITPFQTLSGLADSFTGNSRASGIVIDKTGRFLYSSHRGSDTLAVMAIDPDSGRLRLQQVIATGGKTPRFFSTSPDQRWLFVLNEDSDTIVTFALDPLTGELSDTGYRLGIGSPTCLVWM